MPVQFRVPHIRGRHLAFIDLLAIAASASLALAISGGAGGDEAPLPLVVAIGVPVVARPLLNLRFGLYRRVWRHASIPEVIQIAVAVGAGSVVAIGFVGLLSLGTEIANPIATRSFWALEGLLSVATLGGIRFAIRAAAEGLRPLGEETRSGGVPTILFGAGVGGAMAIRSARDPRSGIRPVGFLDDDHRLWGSHISGLVVHGGLDQLEELVAETGARRLLITMPNAPGAVLRRIVGEATRIGLAVRTIPRMEEMFDGSPGAYRMRRVRVDDLLHRPSITEHVDGVDALVHGRIVLITGAGGSIGSELARQVFAMRPKRLILIDRAEGPLYGIQRELELARQRNLGAGELSVHIANVATRSTMRRLVRTGSPDVIFHAAAYKHVPMMEEHPSDAVQVNIGGTVSVLEAAESLGVPHLVFVSTDKAVRPSSVMGATKRVAEGLIGEAAARTGRRYVSVRFGNVLGSSGSVVPIFQQQLESGDPLTITHPDMTRYFMTIPEAVWLTLDAAAIGSPGSVLVLDMGEPVRIVDLAKDLIRLSGLDPDSVPIVFTGLRPGEKLHEQLFYSAERVSPTVSERVMLAAPERPLPEIRELVGELVAMATGDRDEELRRELFKLSDMLGQPTVTDHARVAAFKRPRREPASVAHS